MLGRRDIRSLKSLNPREGDRARGTGLMAHYHIGSPSATMCLDLQARCLQATASCHQRLQLSCPS